MRWARHVARMNEISYRFLVPKYERKRSLPEYRWGGDNIKIDLKEIACESVDFGSLG